jgi:hypothetical protein
MRNKAMRSACKGAIIYREDARDCPILATDGRGYKKNENALENAPLAPEEVKWH